MIRRVLVFSILCLLILGLAAWAATEKPKNETAVSDRVQRANRVENVIAPEYNIATKYVTSPMPELFFPQGPDTAGFTYYEYQSNHCISRQIANDYQTGTTSKRHFAWMYAPNALNIGTTGLRYVSYNSKLQAGPFTFGWMSALGITISPSTRAGYTRLDILPDSREVIAYHAIGYGTYTTLNVETGTPGSGAQRTYDVPDSIAGNTNGVWPNVATQKDPTIPVYIHIGEQSNTGTAMGYTRCYKYADSLKCQAPGTPEYVVRPDVIEGLNRFAYYVGEEASGINCGPITSPTSRKVAFVWQKGDYLASDMVYVESNSGGDDWITAGSFPAPTNVTNYGPSFTNQLTAEWCGVYDYSDNLHLFWINTNDGTRSNVTVWHYSSGLPPSKRVRQVTSIHVPDYVGAGAGSNGLAIMLMSAGVNYLGPRNNWLYLLWSQSDANAGPDTSKAGYTNHELYVTASSNGGLSWAPPINITNTHSDTCTAGTCMSENWASIAERVDSVLHIQYIIDLDPGAFVNGEATGTKNYVKYMRYPESSITIPAVAGIGMNPLVWNYPTLRTANATAIPETLSVANTGTAKLFFKVDAPTAAGYVGLSTIGDTIPEGGDPIKVVVTYNNGGPLSDTIVYDSLRVASNKGSAGTETYVDTQWVKFTLIVTNTFYAEEFDTVDTGPTGIKLTFSSAGRMGHSNSGTGVNMTYNGNDYLFDGSVALARQGSTLGATDVYEHRDFLAEAPLEVTKIDTAGGSWWTNWGITKTKAIYAPVVSRKGTPDTWLWWWWTIEDQNYFFQNEKVVVKYVKLYKNDPPVWWKAISQPTPLPTVYFGLGMDMDAAGPSTCTNGSFANIGVVDTLKGQIYMKGDTVCNTSNYVGAYFYYVKRDATSKLKPLGAHVLESTHSIHMNSNDGYPDDTLYKYMGMPGWGVPIDTVAHYEANIVICADSIAGGDGTTVVEAKYALVPSDNGLAGLYKPMCGNANRDEKINVADVVYMVNYLFKGGPKPFMYYANADGNNKITVADVVYMVNYLFKGGTLPKCNYPIALP